MKSSISASMNFDPLLMYELREASLETVSRYLAEVYSDESLQQMHLCGTGAVAQLEDKLKELYGMSYALCVSNATIGLLAIALALDLKEAEFITSPYSYGASLAGWLLLGNRPIFADVDAHTLTLDLESVRSRITPMTKAILAVDIFGIPSDTLALRKLAEEYGLWYIADAAQSLGATRDGLPASALADALVVSFTTGKAVFAGEGGAVVTDNVDLYQKLVWYAQHPFRQSRDLGIHLCNEFGINARIHPLAAVWANAVFEESLQRLKIHQRQCFKIIETLNSIGLTDPINFEEAGISPTFFRLTAAWKRSSKAQTLVEELQKCGFTAELAPSPVSLTYDQPAFQAQYRSLFKRAEKPCPVAERQAKKRFCLLNFSSPLQSHRFAGEDNY